MRSKVTQVNTAEYLYRCRLCGQTYCAAESSEIGAHEKLINAVHEMCVDNQPPLPMVTTHRCRFRPGVPALRMGIADLIGYKVRK